MGNFNRGNRNGGGRSFNSRRNFNERGSDRITLHKTTCSKCGKACEVPFRPSGAKPVFCRECFRENAGSDSRRSDERSFSKPGFDSRNDNRNRDNDGFQYKQELEMLNAKLDKILKILSSETRAIKEEVLQAEEKTAPEKKKRSAKKVPLTSEDKT